VKSAEEEPKVGTRQDELSWGLRGLFWWPEAQATGKPALTTHDWYDGMAWMIARLDPTDPNSLVLAAKGGHNQEMHNQNDVGSFIIHMNGESIIPDLGRGRYTLAYFGPTRYEHFVNSSRGHSVPIVNGVEQHVGREYAAAVLEHRAGSDIDLLSIDMKDVYPKEADLASLRRTVALHRDPARPWVEVTDTIRFAAGPGTCQSVLTTYAQVEIGSSSVLLRGDKGALTVSFDPAAVKPAVVVEKDVDLAGGRRDVNVITLGFIDPRREGEIRLCIEPV
jgi:hypothetical protein